MKRIIALVLCLVLALTVFAACGKQEETPDTPSGTDAKTLSIVSTIFPQYDWLREIVKGNNNVSLDILEASGVDLHSYQPSAEDLTKVANCDLFVYVGGESDEWVETALETPGNSGRRVVNLMEVLGDKVKTEEVKEGMQEEEHEHHHEEIEADDIEDRTLAEFAGEWQSLLPLLESDQLSDYVAHEAEEGKTTEAEAKAALAQKWACDAVSVKIDGDTVSFTDKDGNTASGAYKYAGYATKTDEDGDITGVRYQFETDGEGVPKYIQFNDHGIAPAEEVEHFHLYAGSDSFDALTSGSTNPFFVPADWDTAAIVEELTGHEHEEEMDEHVWLSLQNAAVLMQSLSDTVSEIDPANKDLYAANTAAYLTKLSELDAQYKAAADAAKVKTLLFADRFPFRYLTDDYGLDYYAAFVGCSAESEASFETIAFLAKKADELGLSAILQIESADGSIARTVKDNTETKDQTVLTLDSMQSVTTQDIESGTTYLGVMEQNLGVLRQAIGA